MPGPKNKRTRHLLRASQAAQYARLLKIQEETGEDHHNPECRPSLESPGASQSNEAAGLAVGVQVGMVVVHHFIFLWGP